MARNIGALNVKVGADTSSFQRGMVLSRSEMRLTRRMMRETRTPAEQLQQKLDVLTRAYEAGAISLDDYHRSQVKLRSETPEAKAAAAAHASAQKEAESLTERLMTAEERHAQTIQRLNHLKETAGLKEEIYARAVQESADKLPEAIRRKERMAERERLLSRERQEAEQIMRSQETATDRYNRQVTNLDRKLRRGLITQEAYDREVEKHRNQLPEVIRRKERLARREQLWQREMEEGRRLTQSVETATERYGRRMAELERRLRRGSISHSVYSRHVANARRELRQHQATLLSQVPGLGAFSNALMAVNPAMLAVAVTIGVGIAAYRTASRVIRHTTRRIREQMEAIDESAKAAARLGTIPEELTAIQFAASELAGLTDDKVNSALQRMTRRFAEAANGGGTAAESIDTLGLNAAELSRRDPAEIFRRVADQLRQIQDPAEQVRIAYQLFGREGYQLVSVLREGSGAIDEADAAARALGISVSAIDAAQVEAANDAIGRASAALDGLYNTLAIELAPGIATVADEIQTIVVGLRSATGEASDLGAVFAGYVGALMDAFEIAKGMAKITMPWLNLLSEESALDDLREGLSFSNAERMATDAAQRKQDIQDASAARLRDLDAQRAAQAEVADLEREEQSRLESKEATIGRITDQLRSQVETLRLGAEQSQLLAAERAGADPAQLREIRRLQQERDQITAAKKEEEERERTRAQAREELFRRGEQLTQQLRTPAEILRDELADVGTLLRVGAIDARTAARERAAAEERFRGNDRPAERQLAPTATRGSREAYQLIAEAMTRTRSQADQIRQQQLDVARAQLEAAEKTAERIEQLEAMGAV